MSLTDYVQYQSYQVTLCNAIEQSHNTRIKQVVLDRAGWSKTPAVQEQPLIIVYLLGLLMR